MEVQWGGVEDVEDLGVVAFETVEEYQGLDFGRPATLALTLAVSLARKTGGNAGQGDPDAEELVCRERTRHRGRGVAMGSHRLGRWHGSARGVKEWRAGGAQKEWGVGRSPVNIGPNTLCNVETVGNTASKPPNTHLEQCLIDETHPNPKRESFPQSV